MKIELILTALMMVTETANSSENHAGSKKNSVQSISADAGDISEITATDLRHEIDRASEYFKQLNAIGAISLPGSKSYGTGFLIDKCHVLTNAHVAFKNPLAANNNVAVQFSVGQATEREKQFSNLNIDAKVIAHGNIKGHFSDNGRFIMEKESINSDWAIIKLSKSVSKDVGYIPFGQMSRSTLVTQEIVTAGFPADLTSNGADKSKIYADTRCRILGFHDLFKYAFHNCQVTTGQSGSPLLVLNKKDMRLYAIGMVSGNNGSGLERYEALDEANVGVTFASPDGNDIVDAVKADKCD